MGLHFKLHEDDRVKYHHEDKGDIGKNIGKSRSDMAMFAINIFIGFLKVGVL